MLINYYEISQEGKVWVYQANRQIGENEILRLENELQKFLNTWEAHGVALKASYQIIHRQFIVIALDQNHYAPSGCSIDKSVHFFQELGRNLNLDFFDRSQIFFLEKEELKKISIKDLRSAIKEGKIQNDTLVFDTSVQQKADLENWLKPAKQTWLARYWN